jgi:hypothetical protein
LKNLFYRALRTSRDFPLRTLRLNDFTFSTASRLTKGRNQLDQSKFGQVGVVDYPTLLIL